MTSDIMVLDQTFLVLQRRRVSVQMNSGVVHLKVSIDLCTDQREEE